MKVVLESLDNRFDSISARRLLRCRDGESPAVVAH